MSPGRLAERPAGGLIRPYESELRWLERVLDLIIVAGTLQVGLIAHDHIWDRRYTLLATLAAVSFYLFAELFKLYQVRRSEPLNRELAVVLGVWLGVSMTLLVIGYAFKTTHEYSRLALGTWFLLAPAILAAWRGMLRVFLSELRARGYNTRTVAILGTGREGLHVAQTVRDAPWMGLRLLGFYDDRQPAPGRVPEELPCPLSGTTKELLAEARQGKLDIIYITTLPLSDQKRIATLLDDLSDTTASVYFVPDMFLFSMFHGRWVQLGKLPVVSVFETPFYGANGFLKRLEDIVLAAMLMPILAVPMAAIAIAIKLTSKGPVIYKQRRYGLDGEDFWIWKFRTMTTCDSDDEFVQATREDARVTPLGRFLRRTSLDELPQFFNVVSGSMSIIGPRPHPNALNEDYRKLIGGYMLRHKVRPGIAGWAQANGWRGETDTLDKMKRRVELDLWYIRNWSLLLDLKILLKTIPRLWYGDNAY